MLVEKKLSLNYETLEKILENAEDLMFENISVNTYSEYDGPNEKVRMEYTDLEHPVGIGRKLFDGKETLYINKEYYLKNKDYVDSMLVKIVNKLKGNIGLDGIELINEDKLVNAITTNENINGIGFLGDYALSKEMYEKIKPHTNITQIDTEKVSKELENVYDPIISYSHKKLYDYYDYYQLQKLDVLAFFNPKSDILDNMENLKYLNKDATIQIDNANMGILDSFITGLTANNIKNKLAIKIDRNNKNAFNKTIVPKIQENFSDVTVELSIGEKYSLDEYLAYEKRLDDLVAPALGLSPLERYLYAYNVVKKFKPYKEVSEDMDRMESRNVYKILDNEYMVCAGFSALLIDLLARLGIVAKEMSVDVNIGYDAATKNNAAEVSATALIERHARVQVLIDDPKYNVHGIYCADATWDNDMTDDLYSHALMTSEEHNTLNRENFMSSDSTKRYVEILESKNIEEYYARVNYFLDRSRDKIRKYESEKIEESFAKNAQKNLQPIIDVINKTLYEDYHLGNHNFYVGNLDRKGLIKKTVNDLLMFREPEQVTEFAIKDKLKDNIEKFKSGNYDAEDEVLAPILGYIEKFNPSMHQEIKNKYPYLFARYASDRKTMYRQGFNEVIELTAPYVTSMNNNKISGDTILSAVKELYKVYGLDNVEDKLEETRKVNEEWYAKDHPQRMKITSDGSEIYMNEENIFENGGKSR